MAATRHEGRKSQFCQRQNLLVKTGLFETTAQVSCDFETLKTGGFVDIRRVNLPNGKQISAPIYIDPLDRGAVFSIPKFTSGGEVVDGGVVSFVKNGKIELSMCVETSKYGLK